MVWRDHRHYRYIHTFIHTTLSESQHSTIRHELVHALASFDSYLSLGFHPNIAITEGLAVALAPEDRLLSLDDASASLIINKKISSLEKIFLLLLLVNRRQQKLYCSWLIYKFYYFKIWCKKSYSAIRRERLGKYIS